MSQSKVGKGCALAESHNRMGFGRILVWKWACYAAPAAASMLAL